MSRAFCLALCFSIGFAQSLQAQGDGHMELYGEGVHQFFAGNLDDANQLFTRVIEAGTQDPRPYYFRGIVLEHQAGAGQADFEEAARLEAQGSRAVAVGQALVRIQGSLRGKIERARRDGRVMYKQARMEMQQAQMEEMAAPAVEEPAETTPPMPSETTDEPSSDPFAEGLRSEETTEDSDQPVEPEIDNTSNPFADDPVSPTPTEPAETVTPPADPNPFGTDDAATAPATEDPFGSGDAADPFGGAPANDPFGSGDTPAAGDLFGDQ